MIPEKINPDWQSHEVYNLAMIGALWPVIIGTRRPIAVCYWCPTHLRPNGRRITRVQQIFSCHCGAGPP